MLPLAGLIGLHMLLTKQISIPAGLLTGAAAAAISLGMTVVVDSWFWQRWLWPEGEVLWFNTAQNRCASSTCLVTVLLDSFPSQEALHPFGDPSGVAPACACTF